MARQFTAVITVSDEMEHILDELGAARPGQGLTAEQSISKFIAVDTFNGLALIDQGNGYISVEVDGYVATREGNLY